MNKIYSILLLWLCQTMLFAQNDNGAIGKDVVEDDIGAVIDDDGVVEEDTVTYYSITTEMIPVQVEGFTNWQNGTVSAGSDIWIYTYTYYGGYRFQYWMEGDSIISTDRGFLYIMPARDVKLVAVYKFDPSNPPNPEKLGKGYTLKFESQPAQAGYFNVDSRRVNEGASLWVDTWSNHNYRFKEWQINGAAVSQNQYFEFVMPGANTTLTAVYEFDPSSPQNPGRNEYDEQFGKVIMDDFSQGDLSSEIYQLVGENTEEVNEIVVVGKLSEWDFYAAENYPNCTTFDISRTTQLNYVPGWTYEENQSLTKIALPASIEWIDSYAFWNASNLIEVSCYAAVPPKMESTAFIGIAEGAVLYVPAASKTLYENSEEWSSRFQISAFQSDVTSLHVALPNTTYAGLYLELLNVKSGQKMRYIIGDQTVYSFNNLMYDTQWILYLKNAQDVVLGQIPNENDDRQSIEITKEGEPAEKFFSEEFKEDDILTLRDLTLKVMLPTGEEVTDQTSIRWFDANGTLLAQGNALAGQAVDTELKYQVTLPQNLGEQYILPTEQDYMVGADETITLNLDPLPKKTLTGYVHDGDNTPLAGVVISISQALNGLYSKSYIEKTDADGKFTYEVVDTTYAKPLQLTASKPEYVSQRLEGLFEDYKADITMKTITLRR